MISLDALVASIRSGSGKAAATIRVEKDSTIPERGHVISLEPAPLSAECACMHVYVVDETPDFIDVAIGKAIWYELPAQVDQYEKLSELAEAVVKGGVTETVTYRDGEISESDGVVELVSGPDRVRHTIGTPGARRRNKSVEVHSYCPYPLRDVG